MFDGFLVCRIIDRKLADDNISHLQSLFKCHLLDSLDDVVLILVDCLRLVENGELEVVNDTHDQV